MYFDIGSNIGNWSLVNINKCNKIISIEASPITFIIFNSYFCADLNVQRCILLNFLDNPGCCIYKNYIIIT